MSKKNIGILFPASKKFGGTFQYALSIAGSLLKYSKNYNYTLIYYDKDVPDLLTYGTNETVNYNSVLLSTEKTPLFKKIALFTNLITGRKIFNATKNDEANIIKKYKINLLIIPFPSLFGYRNEIPYIITIPDLMHKYFPKLPEYPFKVRLRRDIEYTNAAKYSVFTVGDSNQGIEDIHKFLKIPLNRCRVIYYMPPGYIYENKDMDIADASRLLSKYNLPDKYLFYPAQFWSHKNHIRLIRALSLIKERNGVEIPLILVGSPQESFDKIMNLVKELKLLNQVLHLGYVTSKEIVALYKKSYALIFPDIMGPTNIPPLEALCLIHRLFAQMHLVCLNK